MIIVNQEIGASFPENWRRGHTHVSYQGGNLEWGGGGELTPWRAPYTPRSFWPLSCIINVHVENVRSCKIQLGNNILVWPCNKLCRLEESD